MAQPLRPLGALDMARALLKRPRHASPASFTTAYTLDGIDAGHLERYKRLLGFAADELPVSYYYLLAQRAHLPTLLHDEFPFRVAGLVHVANEIVEHRRPALAASLQLVTGVAIEPPRPNGAVYGTLVTRGLDAATPVFTCTSTYLAVPGKKRDATPPAEVAPGPRIGAWQLGADSGRAYAAVSGDWNPIHLWRWSARLFGMRAPIIHGMHTMGKACALLEQADGRRLTALAGRFRAPAPLGCKRVLHASLAEGRYTVRDGERLVLEGRYAFAG